VAAQTFSREFFPYLVSAILQVLDGQKWSILITFGGMIESFTEEYGGIIASALAHARALFDRNRHLLDDFEAEAFEGGDVHGRVREQADALDAEVGEDLAAEADGAQDAAGAGLGAFAGAQFLMEDEAAGMLFATLRRDAACPPG
jgi:hypothetical protein